MTTNELVTLATFPTPDRAGFLRNLLEAEGIHAYLADETAAGMMWLLNTAMGGVKVQVAESDVARATEILEEHRQTIADLGDDAFAAEALSSAPLDDIPGEMNGPVPDDEPDDVVVSPTDELASRAFRAAGIGVAFFPVLIYAVWLVARLILSKDELSDRASRHLWFAFGITFVTLLGWWVLIRGLR